MKNKILECSIEEYHSDPGNEPSLSSSSAHTLISKSPLHCWMEHPRFGNLRPEPTKEMDRGTLMHTLLLGKGREIVALEFDDWRKQAARDERDKLREGGFTAVLRRQLDDAIDAIKIIQQRLEQFEIDFSKGTNEVAFQWYENGVRCKMRLDFFHYEEALILDLKTTFNAHPQAIQSIMIRNGLDIQHATYTSGITKLYPELEGRIQMGFVFVECEPPFAVLPVIPVGTMKELGRRKWKRAVEIWKECIATNIWPGYSDSIYYVDAPMWALQQEAMYGEIEDL